MKRGWWLLLLWVAIVACQAEPSSTEAALWLEATREANALADEAQKEGDTERAKRLLQGALEKSPPEAMHAEDARIVQQDIYYRLATMDLADEAPERALEWAEQGLSLGTGRDVFTANLLIVRGQGHEALGHDEHAARDYHEALKITDALLQDKLESATESAE